MTTTPPSSSYNYYSYLILLQELVRCHRHIYHPSYLTSTFRRLYFRLVRVPSETFFRIAAAKCPYNCQTNINNALLD